MFPLTVADPDFFSSSSSSFSLFICLLVFFRVGGGVGGGGGGGEEGAIICGQRPPTSFNETMWSFILYIHRTISQTG